MMTDISSKAKPCPMCGSKRIYMTETNDFLFNSVAIKCADCGLNGYKNFVQGATNTVEKTIEYWNTRS